MHRTASALLLLGLCLAGCWSVEAAATSKKCMVVPPTATVPPTGVAGWNNKPTSWTNALGLTFAAGELYEGDPFFGKQKCPPHTGETADERMALTILGVCTKVKLATNSNLYRVAALIGYPCKGRAASTLKLKSGTYKCPKNRFCVKVYITADAPFAFDFSALSGAATNGEGEGEGYGDILSSVLDLHIKVARFT